MNIDTSKVLDNDELKEDPDEFVKALIADNNEISKDLTPKLGGKLSFKSSSKKELKTSKSVNESNIKNNLRDSKILTPLQVRESDKSPSLLRRSERIELEDNSRKSKKHTFHQKFRDFSHSSAEELRLAKIKEVEATKQSLLSLSESQTREKEDL